MTTSNRNPSYALLSQHLPASLWKHAEKQATRSVFKLFRTGAILTDGRTVLGKGCSHMRDVPARNIHAEQHALLSNREAAGLTCVIVTLNKRNNWAASSKPCARCAYLLHNAGVETVMYAERDNVGEWSVNVEKVANLVKRVNPEMLNGKYAKQMRIAA